MFGQMKWSDSISFHLDDVAELEDATDGEETIDLESSKLLLSEAKLRDLAHRFRRDCDAYYVEVKRSMVSSIARIPYWIYGALVFLGWNEFVAVIRSPVYFTFLLLAITGA